MCTTPAAPGAAKFLLNWPTTDANIATRAAGAFVALVRKNIRATSDKLALPDIPLQIATPILTPAVA
jgi:hypothetical protein